MNYPTTSIAPRILFRDGALEMGPKTFFRKDDDYLDNLYTELFRTYRQLLKDCENVSLYFWLGDGSEILEYNRDFDQEVSWAKWQGFAHRAKNAAFGGRPATLYTDHPVDLTYGDIRRVVSIAKACCRRVLGKELKFVLPFDPGSEFTASPFRYERHTEILVKSNSGQVIRNIDALSRFHADTHPYACYPDGIPEGTPFGEFLGKQAQAYLSDMGADGIWFSNGFGFGRSPYASGGTGEFFDGETFRQSGNAAIRDAIIEFWELFRKHCPSYAIVCRGTDFPVGVNLVNHASAYSAIYSDNRYGIVPPPNTPWSGLTHNHGLALAGYLTQNAPFPGDRFPLRFYTTDQWFCNNPWFDRWDRSPHDIYLSASMCKFTPDGQLHAVNDVHVMGVDGAWGEIVSEVADEVIPHLKRAAALAPDAPPPLLWVYPFDEYNEYVFGSDNRMDEPYGGDISIVGALNHALPLAGVVTSTGLAAVRDRYGRSFAETVLLTPPPDPGTVWEREIMAHLAAGGKVLCYGSLKRASAEWKSLLGLSSDAAPLAGEVLVAGKKMLHESSVGQGGLCETAVDGSGVEVLATAEQGTEKRVLASVRCGIAWVRGGTNVTRDGLVRRRMDTRPEDEWFAPGSLYTVALARLGWSVEPVHGLRETGDILFLMSRHAGGFIFAGHSPDDGAAVRVKTPLGAPVPLARTIRLVDGAAEIPVRTWSHDEVRVFVRQKSGVVGCHSQPVIARELVRRWYVDGLEDATVRFYVEPGCETVYYETEAPEWGHPRETLVPQIVTDATGSWFELEHYTGGLSVGWGARRERVPLD